ncbi:ras gtpase-related [Anaeramoeba flamelloides]|uniref:Ras gtpase-related n=1 Tax=Anaeramoeba flamelloides TaxID=1746091 RepID=A0ABQ8Y108_9EUKA|nr:ras gtpase-related [Anaeramoeba flamelloides]
MGNLSLYHIFSQAIDYYSTSFTTTKENGYFIINLLGSTATGKTSLINYFKSKPFCEEYQKSTKNEIVSFQWVNPKNQKKIKIYVNNILSKQVRKEFSSVTKLKKLSNVSKEEEFNHRNSQRKSNNFSEPLQDHLKQKIKERNSVSGIIFLFNPFRRVTFEWVIKQVWKLKTRIPILILSSFQDLGQPTRHSSLQITKKQYYGDQLHFKGTGYVNLEEAKKWVKICSIKKGLKISLLELSVLSEYGVNNLINWVQLPYYYWKKTIIEKEQKEILHLATESRKRVIGSSQRLLKIPDSRFNIEYSPVNPQFLVYIQKSVNIFSKNNKNTNKGNHKPTQKKQIISKSSSKKKVSSKSKRKRNQTTTFTANSTIPRASRNNKNKSNKVNNRSLKKIMINKMKIKNLKRHKTLTLKRQQNHFKKNIDHKNNFVNEKDVSVKKYSKTKRNSNFHLPLFQDEKLYNRMNSIFFSNINKRFSKNKKDKKKHDQKTFDKRRFSKNLTQIISTKNQFISQDLSNNPYMDYNLKFQKFSQLNVQNDHKNLKIKKN